MSKCVLSHRQPVGMRSFVVDGGELLDGAFDAETIVNRSQRVVHQARTQRRVVECRANRLGEHRCVARRDENAVDPVLNDLERTQASALVAPPPIPKVNPLK